MSIKYYKVGGYVRDKLLGVTSKDVDFAVEAPSYTAMRDSIVQRGGEIFLEKPEYLTIRAKVPTLGAADFVLCRKDGAYSDGRRPDSVEVGTIYDDLARRDFTCNAIAEDENGKLLDPHCGVNHIHCGVLKCVGKTEDRMREDPLRLLRAMRFHITKGFTFSDELFFQFSNDALLKSLILTVSSERIREELLRCFSFSTIKTLSFLSLSGNWKLCEKLFDRNDLWLEPTMKRP
jgi:tRNA nucleotidyltransferase (CCA-adding enzyme)